MPNSYSPQKTNVPTSKASGPQHPSLLPVVDKHHDQKEVEEDKVSLAHRLQSISEGSQAGAQELRSGTEAETTEVVPLATLTHAPSYLPRHGTAHSGTPTSITNKENVLKTGPQASLIEAIL